MKQLLTKEEQAALDRVKPLCVDCKHHILNRDWDEHQCKRTGTPSANNVTGKVHISHRECSVERNHSYQGSCGKRGVFFEETPEAPKQSWIERLISWVN